MLKYYIDGSLGISKVWFLYWCMEVLCGSSMFEFVVHFMCSLWRSSCYKFNIAGSSGGRLTPSKSLIFMRNEYYMHILYFVVHWYNINKWWSSRSTRELDYLMLSSWFFGMSVWGNNQWIILERMRVFALVLKFLDTKNSPI